MNLINDLGSELAFAVLIEKRNSEKLNSEDILPLIKRISDALNPISSEEESNSAAPPTAKNAKSSSH